MRRRGRTAAEADCEPKEADAVRGGQQATGHDPRMTMFMFLQTPSAAQNPIVAFLPLLLIIVIFYLLVFMPMQKQRKKTQQMIANLQNGNVVLTSGGIVGTITAVNSDDTLILRVKPDNIKLQVSRASVTGLVQEEKKS